MRVIWSGVGITSASGKLGGQVASHNKGGSYFRTKVKPLNGQTTAQNLVRSNFTGLAQGWKGLTAAQQLAWNAFGAAQLIPNKLGHKHSISGENAYIRFNQVILNAGGTIISVPPAATTVVPLASLSATAVHAGAVTLTFTAAPVPAGTQYQVFATPGLSAGKQFVKNRFRSVSYLAAAAASPAVITTAYDAKFGAPIAGQTIWFKVRAISSATGYVSNFVQASCVVS